MLETRIDKVGDNEETNIVKAQLVFTYNEKY